MLFILLCENYDWQLHCIFPQNVLLFSCHPIGQLCLGGSGYRSHTVILYSAALMEFTHYTVQTGDDWMSDVG